MLSLQDEIVQVHSCWKYRRKRGSVIINLTGNSLADTSYICKACITQVKRNINSDTSFHPRWLPRQANPMEVCCIKSCKHLAYTNTNLVSSQQLENVLDRSVVAFTAGRDGTQVPLCHTQYLGMYYKTQQSNPCDSCKAKPWKGEEQFGRHCSSLDIISGYLNLVIVMNQGT